MPDSENEAPVTSPGTETTSQLSVLLEVQEEDLALDRLAYRRRELPERARASEIGARADELSARIAALNAEREVLATRLAALEQRSDAAAAREKSIEDRLRSGRAGSYRDEQALADEAASLAQQRRKLEDEELELMEALEPIDTELTALGAAAAAAADELESAGRQLAVAEAAIDAEAAATREAREALAAGLEPELRASYERLRTKLGGVGAAHVVGGACSGCHLQVPAAELHRLRRSVPGTVVYCDQCGRILVP